MSNFNGDVEGNLARLRETLKAKTFEPMPVRRVYIPKSHGKKRPLGIPTIEDRIVQEALRMALEPIWEADLSIHSYGFRPNRSTYDTMTYIGKRLSGKSGQGYQWVIEGDITSYFDTIPHQRLIKAVKKRVADRNIRDLLWKFLRAGVMSKEKYQETLTGTPQGGIVTPPTKLQTFFFEVRIARVRIDSKDDIDLVLGYVDPLHEGPDEVPFVRPIRSLQAVVDVSRKVFQTANDQRQFCVHGRLICQLLALLLQTGDTLAQAGQPGLKFGLVDEPLCVTVD